MKDNPELLDLIIADEARADALYRPGPYWRFYRARVLAAIRQYGITDFRNRVSIGKGFADTVLLDPLDLARSPLGRWAQRLLNAPPLAHLTNLYLKLIRLHWKQTLAYRSAAFEQCFGNMIADLEARAVMPETTMGGTRDLVTINGSSYATPYIIAAARIFAFASRGVGFGSCKSFVEIGGGFGAATHLLLSLYPNIRKVIYLDIAPMIYIGTEYLRHFYGSAVIDYQATKEREELRFRADDSLEILCLCPWQLPRIRESNVDFLYNAASFSEMTPAIVENYAHHAKRIMKPNASLLMILNKLNEDDRPGIQVATPEKVVAAFAPEFQCEAIPRAPLVDIGNIYVSGRRIPGEHR